MAIPTPIARPGALPVEAVPTSPLLVVLVLLTGVVLAMIYAYQPPLPQTMAFAFLPWTVTVSILGVLAADGEYPSYLLPLFTEPGVYLLAVFVPGLAWVAMLNLSISRGKLPAYHHYIGTMGTGAMAILWSVLILHVGSSDLSRLLVVVILPVVALLATGLVSLSIGFWSPDFVDYTAIVGGFAVFGALVNGIATTTTVAANGASAHTPFSGSVWDVVAVLAPGGALGFDATHLWAWLFLLANLAVGIHVATQLAPYAETSPRAVNAMIGSVGLVGFTLGFNRLLLLVVG